jgi:hypothetical protein
LLRRFSDPAALRFGLPGDASQWQRLEQALVETVIAPEVSRCHA